MGRGIEVLGFLGVGSWGVCSEGDCCWNWTQLSIVLVGLLRAYDRWKLGLDSAVDTLLTFSDLDDSITECLELPCSAVPSGYISGSCECVSPGLMIEQEPHL